jgi:hypothetical protein
MRSVNIAEETQCARNELFYDGMKQPEMAEAMIASSKQ